MLWEFSWEFLDVIQRDETNKVINIYCRVEFIIGKFSTRFAHASLYIYNYGYTKNLSS